MPKVERLALVSIKNFEFLSVKNKLSQKPRIGVNKLNNYLNDKYKGRIMYPFPRFELRQNYSNNTVEITKMLLDNESEKFKPIGKRIIPATSGTSEYRKAVEELQEMDDSIRHPKTKIDKILEFICNLFDRFIK